MKNYTYKLTGKSPKKDFIFNMFGSTAMSFVSVLLLVIVSYIKGEESAGIFSLCYTTAQMMFTMAVFEARTVQITDTQRNFSFSDFALYRILTVALMMAVSTAFVIFKGFSREKVILAVLFCAYMALIAVSDLFQGNMQLNGYLRIAGLSLGSQVILAATGFTVTLAITKNMLVSAGVMIAVVFLWIVFFDIPYARNYKPLKPRFVPAQIKKLFISTLPLFISVFLNQYNLNTPKYAIDKYLTEIDQSHYGYLVMPAFVINLMSIFVFRPQIVSLSEKWHNREYKRFGKTVSMLYGWIGIVTVVALVGGYFLGIPILNLLYKTNLNNYRALFEVLLIGGGFSACSSLTIVLLAVIKKQKYSLIAYGTAFIVGLFGSDLLVKHFGFSGAAFSYLTVTSCLCILLVTIFLILSTVSKRKEKIVQ